MGEELKQIAEEKYKEYAELLDTDVETVKRSLKPWRIKKAYYKQNPADFINEQVKIEDKDRKNPVIPFNLWPEQKEALKTMLDNDRVICLKARQLGLTWLAIARSSHLIIFNEGKSVSTISIKEDDVKELIKRMEFILRHLPNWLIVDEKGEPEDIAENKTGITYTQYSMELIIHHPDAEDSRLNGHTSSPSAARSFTDNIIILDEWAFHPQAREIWRAAYPVINRKTGGDIIGISTGEKGTLFQEKWENAEWEYGGEAGNNSNTFKGIFLPWDVHPERDREWYERTKQEMQHYQAEYPSTPSEAFTTGEGQFFTEFDRDIHVVYDASWYPPLDWRIVMAYDGGYRRAAAKWYAISNDGWAICYREYYPQNKIDPIQMEDIRKLSKDPDGNPENIQYIVADTSCWAKSQDTGKTTVEIGEEHGIRPWRQADKDRIMGWRRLHEWLHPIRDEQNNIVKDRFGNELAKLRYTESCSNTIRIFPGLKGDESTPDDLASGQEDHLFDVDRYFVMSRPKAPLTEREKKERKQKRKRRIKTRSKAAGY